MKPRVVAMGDPQAPIEAVKAVLATNRVLDGDRVARATRLVSMGDHFDWGPRDRRAEASVSGVAFLRWLASHDPNEAVILAGNHDLARVGELSSFVDDDDFAAAQALADRAYFGGDAAAEEELLRRWPLVPTAELLARDLSTYRAEQQTLVLELLQSRRMRLAWSEGDVLFTHAGVTEHTLHTLGLPADASAGDIACALNAALDAAVQASCADDGSLLQALSIPGLHTPGTRGQEGDGILYHRPQHVSATTPLLRRRYDARHLPQGLIQAIGHIRDKKCRQLLGPLCDANNERAGVLRHLRVEGADPRCASYAHGLPSTWERGSGWIVFVDGDMLHCPTPDYQILDLRRDLAQLFDAP